MPQTATNIQWNKQAREKYERMILKIPIFHRDIAKKVVDEKAVINAKERGAAEIQEDDIAKAFITEVPKAFYSLMVRIMDEVGLDYKKFNGESNK